MGKEFEIRHHTTVNATPQQIWDTIATGPGISSWFIGRTTIDNGTVHTDFGGIAMPPSTITDNEPPTHFAHHSGHTPDGRFIANEFLIEARDHSATILRTVASGFLPGDDWTDEYEAMRYGTEMFFATLDQTLHHFPGRTATPVTVFGPQVTDWPATWARLYDTLGLTATPRPGDTTTNGDEVYFTNPHTLGLRTPTALHRYIRGFHGPLIAAHELFDGDPNPQPWSELLHRLHTSKD